MQIRFCRTDGEFIEWELVATTAEDGFQLGKMYHKDTAYMRMDYKDPHKPTLRLKIKSRDPGLLGFMMGVDPPKKKPEIKIAPKPMIPPGAP